MTNNINIIIDLNNVDFNKFVLELSNHDIASQFKNLQEDFTIILTIKKDYPLLLENNKLNNLLDKLLKIIPKVEFINVEKSVLLFSDLNYLFSLNMNINIIPNNDILKNDEKDYFIEFSKLLSNKINFSKKFSNLNYNDFLYQLKVSSYKLFFGNCFKHSYTFSINSQKFIENNKDYNDQIIFNNINKIFHIIEYYSKNFELKPNKVENLLFHSVNYFKGNYHNDYTNNLILYSILKQASEINFKKKLFLEGFILNKQMQFNELFLGLEQNFNNDESDNIKIDKLLASLYKASLNKQDLLNYSNELNHEFHNNNFTWVKSIIVKKEFFNSLNIIKGYLKKEIDIGNFSFFKCYFTNPEIINKVTLNFVILCISLKLDYKKLIPEKYLKTIDKDLELIENKIEQFTAEFEKQYQGI